MPEIGEIRLGNEVGFNHHSRVQWSACASCGKERWIVVRKKAHLCLRCGGFQAAARRRGQPTPVGEKHGNWKGGYRNSKGYAVLTLPPDSPYIPMARSNRAILEHRLIMAQSIGRCLLRSEIIHHLNGIPDDNRIENLKLVSVLAHQTFSEICSHCELRKEVRLLRWEIKEMRKALQLKLATVLAKVEV